MFLGILVGFEQQVDQSGDGTSVPQGCLILWTQGQVSNQADHSLWGGSRETFQGELSPQPNLQMSQLLVYLDDWPVIRRVEKLDDGRDAIVLPHSVLRKLGLLVARSKVAQSANSRFGHILFFTSA